LISVGGGGRKAEVRFIGSVDDDFSFEDDER
jgi:hypothetical protein